MKVKKQTPDLLIIEERPWLVGLILLVFVGVFLAFAVKLLATNQILPGLLVLILGAGLPLFLTRAMVRRITLVIDRKTGQISREQIGGGPRQSFSRSFAGFRNAELDVFKSNVPGEGNSYRLKLVMEPAADSFLFREGRTPGDGPANMVKAINNWLAAAK